MTEKDNQLQKRQRERDIVIMIYRENSEHRRQIEMTNLDDLGKRDEYND